MDGHHQVCRTKLKGPRTTSKTSDTNLESRSLKGCLQKKYITLIFDCRKLTEQVKQQTELVTLLVTIHQQRAPKVDILAKALILADVQPVPRVKVISYWLNCQLCRMKFKSRADISAHMKTHPVSGMITRTSFCCKETFRYKSLRVETGLATSSIFQFSFLQKIIDLLGG